MCGKKRHGVCTSLQVATMIGISIPSFISALIFIYLFAIKIPIFPTVEWSQRVQILQVSVHF